MTRKKYIKTLMGMGYSRREALATVPHVSKLSAGYAEAIIIAKMYFYEGPKFIIDLCKPDGPYKAFEVISQVGKDGALVDFRVGFFLFRTINQREVLINERI